MEEKIYKINTSGVMITAPAASFASMIIADIYVYFLFFIFYFFFGNDHSAASFDAYC